MLMIRGVKLGTYKRLARSLISLAIFYSLIPQVFAKTKSKSVFSLTSSFYNQTDFNENKYQLNSSDFENKFLYKKNNIIYKHHLGGFFQLGRSSNSFDLKLSESYVGYRGLNNNLSLGRKKVQYSQADDAWSLGLVSPLFNQDYLSPEKQGLVGFHYEYKNKSFYIQAYGSYIHTPHQLPSFDVKDSKVSSLSPWFALPPEQISEQGGLTPVRYSVNRPELKDLLFQKSFGFKVGVNKKQYGLSLGYLNKPNNDFHKMLQFSEELTTNDYFVLVEATTKRHQLYMADAFVKIDDANLWLSLIKDTPESDYEKDKTWQETVLDEQTWFSLGFKQNHIILPNLELSSAYIKRVDDKLTKKTLLTYSELDRTLSRSYFRRSESVQVKLKYKYYLGRQRKLKLLTRYEYSIADRGHLNTVRIGYDVHMFSMFAEGGVISSSSDDKSSFFNSYKGNDFLSLGVSYVF